MSKKLLAQAKEAHSRGDYEAVAELLGPEVTAAAEDVGVADRVHLVRAAALMRARNPRGALEALDAMATDRRQGAAATRIEAAAHLATGDHAAAERALRLLARTGAADARAAYASILVRRGMTALSRGEHAKAIEAFRTANPPSISDAPTQYAAWLGLLTAFEIAGDHDGVLATFAMFPHWANDERANVVAARSAIACMEVADARRRIDLLARSPHVWSLRWALCHALATARRYQEVVQHFGAIAFEVGNAPEARLIAASVVIALQATRRHADARRLAAALPASLPGDPLATHLAAWTAHAGGDLEGAEAHLTALSPDYVPAMLLQWVVAFQRGRFDVARDSLTPQMVRCWPTGPERQTAAMIAALASTYLGEWARAVAVLRDNVDTNDPTVLHLAGFLALAEGRYATAAAALPTSPLRDLAILENARDLADHGELDTALAQLDALRSPGLAPRIEATRHLIWVEQARDSVRRDDVTGAQRLLQMLRREAPGLADSVSKLEDYVRVRSALANLRGGEPTQVADALWRMRTEVPADASPAQRLARRRDLSFLAAVSWLRGLEARPRDGSLLVDKAVDALEESLDADAAFAPAAALFGLVLQYLGDTERSLELLDVAQRRGLTSPAMGVALAAEYVRAGRLVEAKRIFFEQLAGGRRNAGAARRLRELLVIERTPLLLPSRRAAPSRGELPERSGEVSPFATVPAEQRVFVLLRHVENEAARAPDGARDAWQTVARDLKQLVLRSAFAELDPIERRALALLSGRAEANRKGASQ